MDVFNFSSPPYYNQIEIDRTSYFPPFQRLRPPSTAFQDGRISVGFFATLSASATFTLISFILYRFVSWKHHHHETFMGYNQYVLLVLNLLVADFQQSASYLLSLYWIRENALLVPSSPRFAQKGLLHSGNTSSGFFILAIAAHTYYTTVLRRRVGQGSYILILLGIWLFTFLLTAIGPMTHREKLFVRAGAWCWMSEVCEIDRSTLYTFGVCLVQISTVFIYTVMFVQFLSKSRGSNSRRNNEGGHGASDWKTVKAIRRINLLMAVYPCAYIVLTLPLSAGRMWSMAQGGKPYSNTYALVAGSLLTSCGWVNSLLYMLTRGRLLEDSPADESGRKNDLSSEIRCLQCRTITYRESITRESKPQDGSHTVSHNNVSFSDNARTPRSEYQHRGIVVRFPHFCSTSGTSIDVEINPDYIVGGGTQTEVWADRRASVMMTNDEEAGCC